MKLFDIIDVSAFFNDLKLEKFDLRQSTSEL